MTDYTPTAVPVETPAAEDAAASTDSAALRAEHAHLSARRDQLVAELERARTEQIEPGDRRLAHVWALAERYAQAAGELGHYNTLARELDGPVTEREYLMDVRVTYTAVVSVSVMAESYDDAQDQVDNLGSADIDDAVERMDLDLDDWELAE